MNHTRTNALLLLLIAGTVQGRFFWNDHDNANYKNNGNNKNNNDNNDSNNNNNAEKGCIKAAHNMRFAWCDALRGTISAEEWQIQGAKFIAAGMETQSNDPANKGFWGTRDEFLDPVTGYIQREKETGREYQVCIPYFAANYKSTHDRRTGEVTIEIPCSKFYTVAGLGGPPGTPPVKMFEYDMDTYKCVKENGEWKVEFWGDTQTILNFDPPIGPPPGTPGGPPAEAPGGAEEQ